MHHQTRFRFAVVAALLLVGTVSFVPARAAEQPAGSEEAGAATEAPQYVAYYFHGNLRCATCRKLEAYSEEAIAKGFADELASGKLTWRVVNTDEAENKHFVKDFELVTKSVVLVEYRDGEVARSENLAKVWQLVGDKDGFLEYVRDSTSTFLEAS